MGHGSAVQIVLDVNRFHARRIHMAASEVSMFVSALVLDQILDGTEALSTTIPELAEDPHSFELEAKKLARQCAAERTEAAQGSLLPLRQSSSQTSAEGHDLLSAQACG